MEETPTPLVAPGGGGGLSRRLPSSHSPSASGLAPSLAAASAAAKAGSGRSKTNDGAVPASVDYVDYYLPAGARPSYDDNPTSPLATIPAQSPAQFPGGEGSGGAAFTSPSNSRESGDGERRRGKRKWYERNAAASPPPVKGGEDDWTSPVYDVHQKELGLGYFSTGVPVNWAPAPAPTTTQPLKYAAVQDAPAAYNRGPLSPINTRDNNARTSAPNGVTKPRARRNRPRPGSASSSVASSAAASPTSTPPSTKVARQPGNPPRVVSTWICTPQSTIDLANSPGFRGNPDPEIRQALEDFDYLENRVDPTDASQILRDYERIAVNGFADVVGDDTANRGQRPSGNRNCIMTGFATHLCKLFRGGGRANKVNPDQRCIKLLVEWLLYGILKDGRTEGITTDIAKEFAAENVSIFDCFLRCCDKAPGCPEGSKYEGVFDQQLKERSWEKGLSGDAVMGLYKLQAANNIAWHAVHLHALKKGPLNLLSACIRNAEFVWNNTQCKPLSSPYINVFFIPHPENYPGRLACPLKFPVESIDRFSERLCGWAQGFKGLSLPDNVTPVRVPATTDETKVIRRMAKMDKKTPEERAAVAEATRKDCSRGGTEAGKQYHLAKAFGPARHDVRNLSPAMEVEYRGMCAKPRFKVEANLVVCLTNQSIRIAERAVGADSADSSTYEYLEWAYSDAEANAEKERIAAAEKQQRIVAEKEAETQRKAEEKDERAAKRAKRAAEMPTGVKQTSSGKFEVIISYVGKNRYIGTFDSKEEAVQGRDVAREVLQKACVGGGTDEEKEAKTKRNVGLAKEAARRAVGGASFEERAAKKQRKAEEKEAEKQRKAEKKRAKKRAESAEEQEQLSDADVLELARVNPRSLTVEGWRRVASLRVDERRAEKKNEADERRAREAAKKADQQRIAAAGVTGRRAEVLEEQLGRRRMQHFSLMREAKTTFFVDAPPGPLGLTLELWAGRVSIKGIGPDCSFRDKVREGDVIGSVDEVLGVPGIEVLKLRKASKRRLQIIRLG